MARLELILLYRPDLSSFYYSSLPLIDYVSSWRREVSRIPAKQRTWLPPSLNPILSISLPSHFKLPGIHGLFRLNLQSLLLLHIHLTRMHWSSRDVTRMIPGIIVSVRVYFRHRESVSSLAPRDRRSEVPSMNCKGRDVARRGDWLGDYLRAGHVASPEGGITSSVHFIYIFLLALVTMFKNSKYRREGNNEKIIKKIPPPGIEPGTSRFPQDFYSRMLYQLSYRGIHNTISTYYSYWCFYASSISIFTLNLKHCFFNYLGVQ